MVLSNFHMDKICKYYHKQYSHNSIILKMASKYNVFLSRRNVSKYLVSQGLRRKNIEESPLEEIVMAIMIELEGSGMNLGYRSMCHKIKKLYNLSVKEKTVMKLLKEMDPDGVNERTRYRLKRRMYNVPGPNYLWHGDGHDKLKRFGFAIYGIIDGFSKKLLLLEVGTTNNNPQVIGHYYCHLIKKMNCLPTVLRTDHGSEVVVMEAIQIALRFDHEDSNSGEKSFLKGKSTHNQRIESYWRLLRQSVGDFYIDLFKLMESMGILDVNNPIEIECLRFCFGSLIQRDLLVAKKNWNEHTIRKQNGVTINGKPNDLFHHPEKFGVVDCRKPVQIDHVDFLEQTYTVPSQLHSHEIKDLILTFIPTLPNIATAEEAFNFYTVVINYIRG